MKGGKMKVILFVLNELFSLPKLKKAAGTR